MESNSLSCVDSKIVKFNLDFFFRFNELIGILRQIEVQIKILNVFREIRSTLNDDLGNSGCFFGRIPQFKQSSRQQRLRISFHGAHLNAFRESSFRSYNSDCGFSHLCRQGNSRIGNFRFLTWFDNNNHRFFCCHRLFCRFRSFGNLGCFRYFGCLGDLGCFRYFGCLGDLGCFRYFGCLGDFRDFRYFGCLGDFRDFRHFGCLSDFRGRSWSSFFLIYTCAQLELADRALFQSFHSQQPGSFGKFHDLCKVFIADFSLNILQFDRLCCSALFGKHGDVQIHAAGREAHLAILIQVQTNGQSLSALGDFTCKRTFFFNGAVHRNRGHQNSRLFGRFFSRHCCGISHRCFSGISFGSCGRLFCRSFSGICFRSCGRLFCRSFSGISFRCCRGLFCRSFSGISFGSCGRLCSRCSCGLFCRSSRRLCRRSCGRLCSRGSRRFCRRSSRGLFCRGSRRLCSRGSRGGLCGSLRRFCRRSSRRYGLLDYFGQIGRAFSEDGCRQAVE